MIELTPLANAPRLLLKAELEPLQTDRFQPTGFPDLGPATYTLADDTEMLLVESAQSMANRAEAVCWDEASSDLVPALRGLPYVKVEIADGKDVFGTTASLLEAHRLNSPYVLQGTSDGRTFQDTFLDAAGFKPGAPIDRGKFLAALLRFDPGCLLHGLFMSNVEDGRMRLARALSGFIEARGVRVAQSGGVKNDRVNASGKTEEGFGNVPFARTEFTAASITAFFSVDLVQMRGYGFPAAVTEMLMLLSLYKVRKLLRDGLRLRTACDLHAKDLTVSAPESFSCPSLADLEAALPTAIKASASHLATPPRTDLRFQATAASARASKKAEKARKAAEEKPS